MLLLILSAPATAAFYNPVVVLETNFGNIAIELYPQQAPITVDNFLHYVNMGYYNNLLFHRVIYGFMIQGGHFLYQDGQFYYKQPDRPPIINESYNGLSNLRGTLAMARTTEPHSATDQFYINHIDNPGLDKANTADGYGYCVFGRVIDGMDVVDAIAAHPYITDQSGLSEAFPYNPMIGMHRAYVLPCDMSYCANLDDSDTQVNLADFAEFALHWLDDTCGPTNSFCNGSDLNYSGQVDIVDLDLYLDHLYRTVGYEARFSNLVNDDSIDLLDLMALLEHWLSSNCDGSNSFCNGADIDGDGTVNLVDTALMSANWMKTNDE